MHPVGCDDELRCNNFWVENSVIKVVKNCFRFRLSLIWLAVNVRQQELSGSMRVNFSVLRTLVGIPLFWAIKNSRKREGFRRA